MCHVNTKSQNTSPGDAPNACCPVACFSPFARMSGAFRNPIDDILRLPEGVRPPPHEFGRGIVLNGRQLASRGAR